MTEAALNARLRADARLDALLPKLVELRTVKARLEAAEARLLAEAERIAEDWAEESDARRSGSSAEFPHRSIAAEIGAALRVSDRTVQRQMAEATVLVRDYSLTFDALHAGSISLAHARAIVAAGALIENPEIRAEYEETVLPIAQAESATRLAPIAKRRAEWFADTTFDQRHRRALDDRTVWVTDIDDGMAELRAILPSAVAHGIHDRLGQMARTIIDARDLSTGDDGAKRDAGDAAPDGDGDGDIDLDAGPDLRTTDQVRADVLADLLLTGAPTAHDGGATDLGSIRATVQVTVPIMTLIEGRLTDPYETPFLVGHSPVDPRTARLLTAEAPVWERILTHPISGQVLAVDRYRPGEHLRRHLAVRDQHCRFPGCRMPARRCDADHTIDHARGGPTTAENLALLCRRHHSLKHNTAWTVVQRTGGELEWTSPTRRIYVDRPVSSIEFAPDPECEIPAPDPFALVPF